MYIVNCGYLDAPRVSDRCFKTYRCKSLADVFAVIDNNISKKNYVSVRIADPCEYNISSWELVDSKVDYKESLY